MPKSLSTTVTQLAALLQEQRTEMTMLRTELRVQFTRIAQLQAELDVLPQARRRRQSLRALLPVEPSNNGDRHPRKT
jgi:hypothetical protein